MTAIVGVSDGTKVVMGGDNLGSNDWNCAWNLKSPKIFKSGAFVIGLTGSPRIQQLMQYKLDLEDDPRKVDPLEFMCVDFVDRLRAMLGENGCREQKDSIDGVADRSWAMVAFRGRIFVVQSNFQVMERAEAYDAIGCGGDYALASLHETADREMPLSERVVRALNCAAKFSSGVRPPFDLLESN